MVKGIKVVVVYMGTVSFVVIFLRDQSNTQYSLFLFVGKWPASKDVDVINSGGNLTCPK